LKKKVLLSAITMLTVLAMLTVSVPSVEAKVWSAHGDNLNCHMDVIVDTTAGTLKVKWWDVNAGMDYFYWGSYIHIWDDNGQIYWYDAPLGIHIAPEGELTFAYAVEIGVFLHAEVRWCYQIVGHYWGFSITVRCDLYFESSGGGGNGYLTDPCPTLFVWNGNDYVDYGVIDIHNPSGEDVIREVPVLAEDVDINKHKATFRLREGWEGLNQSESVIDQVKLYAIGDDGKRYLCPLINAEHSRLGQVLPQLLLSDDVRTQILLLETVDLKFIVPHQNVQGFTFVIEGCNLYK